MRKFCIINTNLKQSQNKKELAHASPKRHFSLTCARQPTLCQNIISKTSQLLMHLLYHKRT